MNKLLLTLGSLVLTSSGFAQTFGFGDIVNWTGAGQNEAALVMDWNDGTAVHSYAWGYRWNGSATAEQMLRDIDTADPRLTLGFTFFNGLGYALTAAEYDLDLDGTPEHNEGGFNPGSNGFWDYYVGGPSTSLPSWSESNFGISSVTLSNDDWEGMSWAPDFVGNPPANPVAAPAPEPLTLIGLGIGLVALRRRKQSTPA